MQHFFSFDNSKPWYEIANYSRPTWKTFSKVNLIWQCLWTAFTESPHWTLAGICLIPATSTHLTRLDKLQDWVPRTKPRKKKFISMQVSKQFSRYSPSIFWRQSFRFLSVVTLKSLVYSAGLENEETLSQPIFYAFQITRSCPGTFETVRHSMIRRVDACFVSAARYFEIFLMNYDLINNKNSTFSLGRLM